MKLQSAMSAAIVVFTAIFVSVLVGGCQSQPAVFTATPPAQVPRAFSDADWAKFLTSAVTPDGYVMWDKVQTNDAARSALARYIGLINTISPANHADLFATSNDQLAYWINAYNAMCIYAVIRHDYPGNMLFGPPPGAVFSAEPFQFGSQTLTLDDVVRDKLQPAGDPRIFFALNCCAHSSPPLRQTPYDGAVLDAELVDQGQRYLSDPRAAVRDGDAVKLNDLMMVTHKVDFLAGYQKLMGTPASGIIQALQPYVEGDSPIVGATRAESLGFDWSLNRPPR